MSAFQIELHELEAGAVEKNYRPSPEQLGALFDDIGEEYRLVHPEDFRADVRAQLSDGTIYVIGEIHADFAYRCGRCRAKRTLPVDTDVNFVLMSESQWSNAYGDAEEIALSEEELDVSYYEGDLIDLGELIREAALLELPVYPQCPEDLHEECDRLYEERIGEETVAELEDQKVDLRWTPLKNLRVNDSGEVEKVEDDTKKD